MNALGSIPAVVRFEWKRSWTLPRVAWWLVLTALPPGLIGFVVYQAGRPPRVEPAHIVLYVLCPGLVSMLGVFLWATPWLSSELEGRSWVYPAVRPHGGMSVLLGKYLVAVGWTIPVGLISSAVAAVIIAESEVVTAIWVQWRLVVLSCAAYAAAFALIGVLFPKRAMVIGVFYGIVFEVVFASIPAAVNLLTIQYRLRCLLVRWLEWDSDLAGRSPAFQAYFGEESAAWHLGVLLAMTLGLILASIAVLRWKEFTAAAESDV